MTAKVATRRNLALLGGLATVATSALVVLPAQQAAAHGGMTFPATRSYACYVDGKLSGSGGDLNPKNPACANAVATTGKYHLWNWYGNLISNAAGRHREIIPDGKLCGPTANFDGMTQGRTDFPTTRVTPGSTITLRYNAWAPHPGTWTQWVTKDGWNPNAPLKWSDLEPAPFNQVTNPPLVQGGVEGAEYAWQATLPNKTGRHIIYSIWQRSDSPEAFYNCSDVMFGSGAMEYEFGKAPGSTTSPSPTPTTTTTTAPSDTTPPNAPNGLRVTGTTTSSVSIAWDAASDNVGVTGYRVYRGSELIGTVSGTSFTDSGLASSTKYSYWLRSVDAAGNVSSPSATVEATTAAAATPTPTPTTTTSPSGGLRGPATDRGFRIGTAVANGPLANEATYRDTLAREFNSVTAENSMKWDATEPTRNQFSFSQADAIVSAAQANNQKIYGHTFVWHSQLPGWVSSLSTEDLRAAMNNHISVVGGRYAGKVEAWDVVNEAFNEDGTMRQTVFLQKLGSGYIAEAFRAARAADPNAKLYINDYNVEGINAKSDGMYNLVRSLKSQGVPIDGVGLQAHLIVGQVPSTLQQNIERFAALGLEVRITELDIRMQLPADSSKLTQQANDYSRVVNACRAVAKCVGVTTWGFTDKHSWVPGWFSGQGAALPFDENYRPKPAYDAILKALGGSTTPSDTTAPNAPTQLTVTGKTSSSVSLSWMAASDNVGVTGYDVYRGTSRVATVTGTTYNDTGLSASTAYSYTVRARDAAGNVSAASAAVSTTTDPADAGDNVAPDAPTGLQVTGTTTSSASLSWSAASDNVGVTGYEVFRGSTRVATVTGTSYTDTGLAASTAYSYAVRARDAAGNVSALSGPVTATTQADTTTPPPPPASGGVKVQYKNLDTAASDNQIKPGLAIVNTSTSSVDLSTVTARYYFTRDGGSSTVNVWCDWAAMGCGNVKWKVVPMSSPKAGADTYLEVTFVGSLAAGKATGDIQLRMSKGDWSAFNETNDYSRNTSTTYADNAKITAYRSGALAWGTEPA